MSRLVFVCFFFSPSHNDHPPPFFSALLLVFLMNAITGKCRTSSFFLFFFPFLSYIPSLHIQSRLLLFSDVSRSGPLFCFPLPLPLPLNPPPPLFHISMEAIVDFFFFSVHYLFFSSSFMLSEKSNFAPMSAFIRFFFSTWNWNFFFFGCQ